MHPILSFFIWAFATLLAYFGIAFVRALLEVLVTRPLLGYFRWSTRIMVDTALTAYLFHVFAAPEGAVTALAVVSVVASVFVLVNLGRAFDRWMERNDYTGYFRSVAPRKPYSE